MGCWSCMCWQPRWQAQSADYGRGRQRSCCGLLCYLCIGGQGSGQDSSDEGRDPNGIDPSGAPMPVPEAQPQGTGALPAPMGGTVDNWTIYDLDEALGAHEDRSSLVKLLAARLMIAEELQVKGRPGLLGLVTAAVSAAQGSQTLRRIALDDCGIGDEETCMLAPALPTGLQSLSLERNDIGVEGARALAAAMPASLQALSLWENKIGDEGVRAIAEVLPAGLESLNLGRNEIGVEGVHALAEALPAGLLSLELNWNGIEDEGVAILAVALPTGLQFLNLAENFIGPEGMGALAVALPTGLQSLNLRDNEYGTQGIRALAAALPVGLKSLTLGWSEIRVEGVRALAAALPAGLQSLKLNDSGIGDEGVAILASALPTGLQVLELGCNRIRPEGMLVLAAALPAGLQSLLLSGNEIGVEGARVLAAALPTGLQNLILGLSTEEQEDLLNWLGEKEDPLPVDDVLLLLFKNHNIRARAEVILEGNRKRARTAAMLGFLWPGPWLGAADMRVVLCGPAEVGKTCLRMSFVGPSSLATSERTLGIEVEQVHADRVRFALWDLGGQKEFHLLHAYLMPETSFAAGRTTVFVLVLKVDGERQMVQQEELRYWLRLIASTGVPGREKQVLVVLNRWDGAPSLAEPEYEAEVRRLASDVFRGQVKVWDMWAVDVRPTAAGTGGRDLWEYVVDMSLISLAEAPGEPELCRSILAALPDWVRQCKERYNMPMAPASSLFVQVLVLAGPHGQVLKAHPKGFEAVLSYLQDVGRLLYLHDIRMEEPVLGAGVVGDVVPVVDGLVILEPTWLAHDVAGRLLGLRVRPREKVGLEGGRVPLPQLERFYRNEGYEWSLVKALLLKLRLGYVDESGRMMFVPALLGEGEIGDVFERWLGKEEPAGMGGHVVGCVIKVFHREKHILGPSFFEQLQSALATEACADADAVDGSPTLRNWKMMASYESQQVRVLMHYDASRDCIITMAAPKEGVKNSSLVLEVLTLATNIVTASAAAQRPGVRIEKEWLHPLCRALVLQLGTLSELLDKAKWLKTTGLQKQVEKMGDEVSLSCISGCRANSPHNVRIRDIIAKEELPQLGSKDCGMDGSAEGLGRLERRFSRLERKVLDVKSTVVAGQVRDPAPLPRLCYLKDMGGRKLFKVTATVHFLCEGDGAKKKELHEIDAPGLELEGLTAMATKILKWVKFGLVVLEGSLIAGAILSPISALVTPAVAATMASSVTQQAAQYAGRPLEATKKREVRWTQLQADWIDKLDQQSESSAEPSAADWMSNHEDLKLFTATVLEAVFERQILPATGLSEKEKHSLRTSCGLREARLLKDSGKHFAGDVVWVCEECCRDLEPYTTREITVEH